MLVGREPAKALRRRHAPKRHAHLVDKATKQRQLAAEKARFVEDVATSRLVLAGKTSAKLMGELEQTGYAKLGPAGRPFDHLLAMPLSSLTQDRVDALRRESDRLTERLEALRATTPSDLWLADLDAVEKALDSKDGKKAAKHQ